MVTKLYFAHPINTYGTELEKNLVEQIGRQLPDYDIVNPATSVHQYGYERWKREMGNGMEYFMYEVLPDCNAAIFLAFRDGTLGAGVVKEINRFIEQGCPVWEISVSGDIISVSRLDESRVLSIEETRKRVRDENGEMLPF